MINVIVSNNMDRNTVPVDEHVTIKSVLESQDINYSVGMISIDGATLKPGDINKTFADMGVTDKCYLSVIVKADNAADCVENVTPAAPAEAKVMIAGSVVTIESAFTPDEINTVKKFRPAALSLFGEENGRKTPTFTVGIANAGNGSVGSAGVSYGVRTSAAGKAMVVMEIPAGIEKVKEWAADMIGVSILKLREVEAALPAVIAEIKGEQKKVADAITML